MPGLIHGWILQLSIFGSGWSFFDCLTIDGLRFTVNRWMGVVTTVIVAMMVMFSVNDKFLWSWCYDYYTQSYKDDADDADNDDEEV